jgi:hypothetical protein
MCSIEPHPCAMTLAKVAAAWPLTAFFSLFSSLCLLCCVCPACTQPACVPPPNYQCESFCTGMRQTSCRVRTVGPLGAGHSLFRPVSALLSLRCSGVSGQWSSCSASCGGGSATRTVQCVNTVDSTVQADESRCASAGTKPATSQSQTHMHSHMARSHTCASNDAAWSGG